MKTPLIISAVALLVSSPTFADSCTNVEDDNPIKLSQSDVSLDLSTTMVAVVVQNGAGEDLEDIYVGWGGRDPAYFTFTGCQGAALFPGDYCVIDITFLPDNANRKQFRKKLTVGGSTSAGDFERTICVNAINES